MDKVTVLGLGLISIVDFGVFTIHKPLSISGLTIRNIRKYKLEYCQIILYEQSIHLFQETK